MEAAFGLNQCMDVHLHQGTARSLAMWLQGGLVLRCPLRRRSFLEIAVPSVTAPRLSSLVHRATDCCLRASRGTHDGGSCIASSTGIHRGSVGSSAVRILIGALIFCSFLKHTATASPQRHVAGAASLQRHYIHRPGVLAPLSRQPERLVHSAPLPALFPTTIDKRCCEVDLAACARVIIDRCSQ